jgi:hypothetical protein
MTFSPVPDRDAKLNEVRGKTSAGDGIQTRPVSYGQFRHFPEDKQGPSSFLLKKTSLDVELGLENRGWRL